jgi:hypothetical protein
VPVTVSGSIAPGRPLPMTMPDENDRAVEPLGAEKAPGEDRASLGATEGPADGIAGPAYPPADTEPDAR